MEMETEVKTVETDGEVLEKETVGKESADAERTALLRSLAKEAAALRGGNAGAPEKPKSRKYPEFTLTLAEYPDVIITKRTPTTTRHLVIMASAGAAFIKTEMKDGSSESETLTDEGYARFTSGMDDVPLPDGFWAGRISKGKPFGRRLLDVIGNPQVAEMIKKKVFPKTVDLLEAKTDKWGADPEDPYFVPWSLYPNLMVEYRERRKPFELLRDEPTFCKSILDKFGLDNIRDFLDNCAVSLAVLSDGEKSFGWRRRGNCDDLTRTASSVGRYEDKVKDGERTVSVVPRIPMKYESFRDYVLYSSVRMGFALSMSEFFRTWNDTLMLEDFVRNGEIDDKYPADLLLLHNQLSYKAACLKQEIDEANFARQVERAKLYEGTYKGFSFVAPERAQDFYDEAAAQANCLAGYVSRFTDGDCLIIFMRRRETPKKSYITVKIDGSDVEAKRASNAEPSMAEKLVLYEWIDKCNKRNDAA